jgi:Domain of unknown function (DUF4189)
MTKGYILFWMAALVTRIPTTDACTAIALASSGKSGAHHEVCAHAYKNPGAAGVRAHAGFDFSRSEIENMALRACRRRGGINPKIVLSTRKFGYFATAVSSVNDVVIWGWAGPLPSSDAATNEAIANCKQRGGTDPHLKDQWHDYFHAYDKHI